MRSRSSSQCVMYARILYYKCASVCGCVGVLVGGRVCVRVYLVPSAVQSMPGVAVNNTTRALIVTLKLKGIGRAATEIADGEKRHGCCGCARDGVDVQGPSVFCYKSLITFYYLSENFARRILNTF